MLQLEAGLQLRKIEEPINELPLQSETAVLLCRQPHA